MTMKILLSCYCVLSILLLSVTHADTKLQLKPSKCVTLKQGKTCFQDVKVFWSSPQKGDYCLFNAEHKKALKCWHNVQQGGYQFEFESTHSVIYVLNETSNNTRIAQQTLSVKWVYKQRPNQSWRIF